MTSVPTVPVIRSEAELLLQIELIKRTTELEKVRLRIKEIEHQAGSAPRVDTQIVRTPALEVTTPAQEPVSLRIESTPAESVNQKEDFKQWLKRDKGAKKAVLGLAMSGGYSHETQNIQNKWRDNFISGMEKINGKVHMITDDERTDVERLRKKCNSPGWNFREVYKVTFSGRDPAKLFTAHRLAQEKTEESVHKDFPLGKVVRLIGRKCNISQAASEDDNLYYIAQGSVFCGGTRDSCGCSEGCIRVMVEQLFQHDGSLQKFGGECNEDLSTHIINPEIPLEWPQSLLRHVLKENIRTKSQPQSRLKKKGKGKEVRRSKRESKLSTKIVAYIKNGAKDVSTKAGAKRGRKRKGGATGRTIEASKPVTSVVERPGKRRTTKLALN